MEPIWKRTDITVTEHRLLWLLVDAGAVGKIVGYGSQKKFAECLGVHRITIRRIVKKMICKGLLIEVGKGSLELNMAGFESPLPDKWVPLREIKHAD